MGDGIWFLKGGGVLVVFEGSYPLATAHCQADCWGDSVNGPLGFVFLRSDSDTCHADRYAYTAGSRHTGRGPQPCAISHPHPRFGGYPAATPCSGADGHASTCAYPYNGCHSETDTYASATSAQAHTDAKPYPDSSAYTATHANRASLAWTHSHFHTVTHALRNTYHYTAGSHPGA